MNIIRIGIKYLFASKNHMNPTNKWKLKELTFYFCEHFYVHFIIMLTLFMVLIIFIKILNFYYIYDTIQMFAKIEGEMKIYIAFKEVQF